MLCGVILFFYIRNPTDNLGECKFLSVDFLTMLECDFKGVTLREQKKFGDSEIYSGGFRKFAKI